MQNTSNSEHRTIFPIGAEEIIRLGIDVHVAPDEMCGVSFTVADLDRAYHRWKNVMQAPNPQDNEMTEQTYLVLWTELEKASKELIEAGRRINTLKIQTLERVREVSKLELSVHVLEQKVQVLQTDKTTLQGLSNSHESKVRTLQKDIKGMQNVIERYHKKYKTLDYKLNWLQRIGAFIFRL